jgi:tetratricopeptide (TPR) repeat protein
MLDKKIAARIDILFNQKRYADVEKLINELLAQSPNDDYLFYLLSQAHLLQMKFESALELIEIAIGLDPTQAHYVFIKAVIFFDNQSTTNSEYYIHKAIAMDPLFPDFFRVAAAVSLRQCDYEKTLYWANKALELDPEHVKSLNLRGIALMYLSQKEDSLETMDLALRQNPASPSTHANYGFLLLEKGLPKKAKAHFMAALQGDPQLERAKMGLGRAFKADNPILKLHMKYESWWQTKPVELRFVFIAALFLAVILCSYLGPSEGYASYLTNVIIGLMVFILIYGWYITPFSDLLLRFSRFGKHLLLPEEKNATHIVGLSLGISIVSIIAYFILDDMLFLVSGLVSFFIIPLVNFLFRVQSGSLAIIVYFLGMHGLAHGSMGLIPSYGFPNWMTWLFVIGVVGLVVFKRFSNK